MLVWIDIETTGLEPYGNVMLELGLVATDNDLDLVDSFHAVIAYRDDIAYEEEFIRNMHTASGLWDECIASTYALREAEADACDWMARVGGKASPMAGSTPHFDRSFLKVHMPRLEDQFHYRNADVSSMREFARRWFPEMIEPTPIGAHRALSDISDTLVLARYYRAELFGKRPVSP